MKCHDPHEERDSSAATEHLEQMLDDKEKNNQNGQFSIVIACYLFHVSRITFIVRPYKLSNARLFHTIYITVI